MKVFSRKSSLGFTLIEMIVVIVLLGVLSTAISSFIRFGTQIYVESTEKAQLISSARFAIERLNREIRDSLPNSLRLTNSSQCIEFVPIQESSTYTKINVAPEPATDTIKVIRFDESFNSAWSAVVYPLSSSDVYGNSGKVHAVESIGDTSGDEWEITLENSVVFAEESPTQRIYFIEGSTEYCLQSNSLFRNGILMAQDIYNTNPFEILAPTLQRNAMVQVHLRFEKNNEQVTFNNEIQVLNVP